MDVNTISLVRVRLVRLSMVSLCTSTTAVGALITIPLPIPITMQLFGVFLSGFILGPIWGAATQVVYIVLGLIGLPIFAGGQGGLSILASPTLGYIIAFPFAAAAIGLILKNKRNSLIKISIAITTAIIIIYSFGVAYLWFYFRYIAGKPLSIWSAITIGALPFLAIDVFKGYLAAVIARRIPKNIKSFL